MDKRDDGGPAFPQLLQHTDGHINVKSEGMTLRDYFAAHAPAPPGEWLRYTGSLREYADNLALWRGMYADAQLRERAK